MIRKWTACLALAATLPFLPQAHAETKATAMQSVSLTAVVVPGAKPLADANFIVTSLDAVAAEKIFAKSVDGPAVVELPSGRYKVVAAYGHSQAATEITVGTGPGQHEISLNAGSALLKLRKHIGAREFTTGVTWEILTFGRDSEGNRHHVAGSEMSQPKFTLPAGFYLARARIGTQEVRHTIEINPGINYNYTLILQ